MYFLKDAAAVEFGFLGERSDVCDHNNVRKKRYGNPSITDKDRELLAENLMRVDVYFETLSVQNITETPKYDSGEGVVKIKLYECE